MQVLIEPPNEHAKAAAVIVLEMSDAGSSCFKSQLEAYNYAAQWAAKASAILLRLKQAEQNKQASVTT